MDIQEQYAKQVEQEVKKFRTEIKRMQESENPYFTPEVVEYETKLRREELEKNVEEIKAKFNAEVSTKIEQMEPIAATSYFKPTEADKRLVSEFVSEFLADAKLGYSESDKLDAFDRFEEKLGYLDENGLSEVRKHLPKLFDALGDDKVLQKKLRGLNATFKQLQTAEKMQLEELKEAKMNGVDYKFRTLRITHPAYSDYKENRSGNYNEFIK